MGEKQYGIDEIRLSDYARQIREIADMGIQVAIVIGGGLGFLYYWKVGCRTGACPLTSNPFISTIYGAVLGALVSGAF